MAVLTLQLANVPTLEIVLIDGDAVMLQFAYGCCSFALQLANVPTNYKFH